MESPIINTLADAGFQFYYAKKGETYGYTGWTNPTSDKTTLKSWIDEDYNLVSVAKKGHGFALDIDNLPACLERGFRMEWLDGYLQTDTPSGGVHAHGLHDADTEALGTTVVNIHTEQDNPKSELLCEIKLNNCTVAAPTAVRIGQPKKKDGTYSLRAVPSEIKRGMCPELLRWIKQHADTQKPVIAGTGRIEFHPDFERVDYLEHHDCTEDKSGTLGAAFHAVVEACPICGKEAVDSTLAAGRTKFIFGGRGVGFICHACGIDSREKLEQRLKEQDPTWEPWPGFIYKNDDPEYFLYNDPNICFDDPAPEAEIPETETLVEEAAALETVEPAPDTGIEYLGEISGCYDIGDDEVTVGTFSIRTQRADCIVPKKIKWFWDGRLPKGKGIIFTGLPAGGKTFTTLDIAARASNGSDWPDGSKNPYGAQKVIYCGNEDDPADTLIPRLMGAGANLANIRVIRDVMFKYVEDGKVKKRPSQVDFLRDMKIIAQIVKNEPDVALLIVDPLASFVGGINMNLDKEVRPVMNQISAYAAKSGIAVILVVHSSKRSDVNAINKISGAPAMSQIVRCAYTFVRDPDDRKLRKMAPVKGSNTGKETGLNFTIEDTTITVEDDPNYKIGHVKWGEEFDESADDLMDRERDKKKEGAAGGGGKKLMAKEIIRQMVANGMCLSDDIFAKGEAEGIKKGTFYDAKDEMKTITATKGKGAGAKWYWYDTTIGMSVEPPPPDESILDDQFTKTKGGGVT